jgi:hypothetical protein
MIAANRRSQCVGGVIGGGNLLQSQQQLHHGLDLMLFGPAVTGQSLFDCLGGILEGGNPLLA